MKVEKPFYFLSNEEAQLEAVEACGRRMTEAELETARIDFADALYELGLWETLASIIKDVTRKG
jgi:hypothetical protein